MPSTTFDQRAIAPSQIAFRPWSRRLLALSIPIALAAVAGIAAVAPAKAVPSFTDQTGQPCQACHVGGFGPQLTPFGRQFKLDGYTLRAKSFNIPLSGMAVASLNHTKRDQVPPPDGVSHTNDNLTFDEGSLFIAGGVGQHFGGFVQITYDGIGKEWAWDNVDLRAVTRGRLFGEDATFGLTLNNSPTVQDAWNSTPVWGYPYTGSEIARSPGAAALIDDALAQGTLGLSAYAWIGQKYYLEAGAYTSPAAGTLSWLGADPYDPGNIHGLAPYGRIAFQSDLGGGTFELGAFALKAAMYPERDRSAGVTDRYTDVGFDASWQKSLGSGDVISAQTRYVHESGNLKASCALDLIDSSAPDCARSRLNEWRGDVSYYWHNKVGLSLGGFSTTGSGNPDLFGPTGKPDSDGLNAQIDYTPWGNGNGPLGPRVNLRLGVQYTAYGKFDGATHNYDGAGANASDNNTLRVFTWLAF